MRVDPVRKEDEENGIGRCGHRQYATERVVFGLLREAPCTPSFKSPTFQHSHDVNSLKYTLETDKLFENIPL
jgi:hypothetical protein